jgi:excinuclease ABC subunit A
VAEEEKIDLNLKIAKLPAEKLKILLTGTNKTYQVLGTNRFGKETYIYERFDGIIKELERRYFNSNSEWANMEIRKYMREEVCDTCQGDRLKRKFFLLLLVSSILLTLLKKALLKPVII